MLQWSFWCVKGEGSAISEALLMYISGDLYYIVRCHPYDTFRQQTKI